MRIPDPIANTTTEAYLAYKAGVLSEGDLKPKLYDPYIHLDAWLAYWAGLTTTYPVKGVGKNLFNGNTINAWLQPNGTPTSSTKDRTSVDYIPVAPNTSYALHGTESTYLKFTQFDSSKTAVSQQTTTSETSLTVTTGPTTAYVRIGWGNADKGATDVILERGSEATAYEPYTGEPEMLTDEEALIAYLSGVTNTYPEEFRDPADVRVAAYLKYLVSARWGRPEYPVTNEELYLSMMDAPYIPAGEPSSDIEIDDTAEAPFKDVKMYGDTNQNGTPNPDYPQAVQTVTGENVVKICGKNLLNLNGFVKGRLDNGVLGYASNTTALSVDGDSISFTTNANYRGITTEYIAVEPGGTYSTNIPTTGLYGAEIAQYDKSMNFISQGSLSPEQTYGNTTHYIRIYLFLRNSGSATLDSLQLELGSTATAYEPYQEQSYSISLGTLELCKIGDYQDYIYKGSDGWYLRKETGGIVLDGNTTKFSDRYTAANSKYRFVYANNTIPNFKSGTVAEIYCDKLIGGTIGNTWNGIERIAYNDASNRLIMYIDDLQTASLADANTWLQSNNIVIKYILATPTDTEITNTALIDQLNALKNGGSYTGTTYIKVSATDPNLPGLLKVEAYKYD